MRCPACKRLVDPQHDDSTWLPIIDSLQQSGVYNQQAVLVAIKEWDEACMDFGGHSVLPTELRDAVSAALKGGDA